MTVPGYVLNRDERGLTKREREVLNCLVAGMIPSHIAKVLGLTKQRIDQLLKALAKKGFISHRGDSVYVKVKQMKGKQTLDQEDTIVQG